MKINLGNMQIVPLVDVTEFIEESIELLNEEWPRSLNIRRISLEKTLNDKPPLSLILINKEENKLIGYSRLCPLPPQNDNNGCWIESVVIWKDLRGKGFGKILMNGIEECAKEFGFKEIFLSTTDKVNFYICCGYSKCSPIFNFGSNAKLFERNGLINLLNKSNLRINENKIIKNNSNILTKPSLISPPPPLIPPPIIPNNNSQKDQKIYLTKII